MMFKIVFLIVSMCVGTVLGNSTSNCGQAEVTISYLNIAVDMITKAKRNIPSHFTTVPNITEYPKDCAEVYENGNIQSGVYTIWPVSRLTEGKSLDVFCDMDTKGGGWTLIQRRGNYEREQDYFFKDWTSYKQGFGDIQKDFWLGNDYIFALTNQKSYSVRFDLKDVEGNKRHALYDYFWIDDENNKYTLHISDYSGDAGDSMIAQHNNIKFSTKDQKNDNQNDQNCAMLYKGGWWYNTCHHSNLNGLYLKGVHESFADGINWLTWKGYKESLDSTEIKIRPKNFRASEFKGTPMR